MAGYTARLLTDRNLRLEKLGEEAAELLPACADGHHGRAAEEGADLVHHTLVALRALGLSLDDVRRVLGERARGWAPCATRRAGAVRSPQAAGRRPQAAGASRAAVR